MWAREYVLASRAAGFGPWRISLNHVLPNIASVLIVQATIQFALAILAEAALSYLGLGTQPPQPSWGRMLNEAQTMLFQAPLLAVYPGLAIALSVLGVLGFDYRGDHVRLSADLGYQYEYITGVVPYLGLAAGVQGLEKIEHVGGAAT